MRSIWLAMKSWRTGSVVLLSFSSGLPLGLVWIAIPDWMRDIGVDIRWVGVLTLAQAPWTLKFMWSPLMDRYAPPLWGRRRGWAAITQVLLCVLTLSLSGVGSDPEAIWVVFALSLAIALAAASQDIVIDAYAVDVLRPEEHGVAVGARTALYRVAMTLSGGIGIYLASQISWRWTTVVLGLCYVPMLLVSWKAPEPESPEKPPKTLREAVWLPFLEAMSRHRAFEILAFVVFYKLADNLSQSLLRPFLNDMGYDAFDRGMVLGTAGVVLTIFGTFLGGLACTWIGVGHSLWIFGFLQIFSNVGYVMITHFPGSRPIYYGAMSFEVLTTGLGMGAFGVLLLRMTRKRFSATQYALFSSLFGLPRILAGPITGFVVDAAGWRAFFYMTMVAGIPGMLLLHRFSPLGVREPELLTEETARGAEPLSARRLAARGVLGGVVGFSLLVLSSASLGALKAMRAGEVEGFVLGPAVTSIFEPDDAGGAVRLIILVALGAISGVATAAVSAARHGGWRGIAERGDSPR
jgi:PAT family beta-lactamase induction signal transducer AmpG